MLEAPSIPCTSYFMEKAGSFSWMFWRVCSRRSGMVLGERLLGENVQVSWGGAAVCWDGSLQAWPPGGMWARDMTDLMTSIYQSLGTMDFCSIKNQSCTFCPCVSALTSVHLALANKRLADCLANRFLSSNKHVKLRVNCGWMYNGHVCFILKSNVCCLLKQRCVFIIYPGIFLLSLYILCSDFSDMAKHISYLKTIAYLNICVGKRGMETPLF